MSSLRTDGTDGPGGPVVPAYFHPSVAPLEWELVEAVGQRWSCVVVNIADGPGSGCADAVYAPLLARLRRAGVRAAGYVDLAHGSRGPAAVLADVERWRGVYGLDAIFLDCFPAVRGAGAEATVARVRATGVALVVANPGVHPVPELLADVDVCVTFEGSLAAYEAMAEPAWARLDPPAELVHLVYAVPGLWSGSTTMPAERFGRAWYATDADGANPWRVLGRWSDDSVHAGRPEEGTSW